MKRILNIALFSLASLAGLGTSQAAVITSVAGGSATSSIFVDSNSQVTLDLRGAVVLNVFDDSNFLGNVTLFDSTGGTDPGFATLAFGNSIMYGQAGSQFAVGTADFLNYSFAVPQLIIPMSFAEIFPGTVTDPALSALINAGVMSFAFDFASQTDFGNGTLFQFTLAGGIGENTVPEPATSGLMGAALVGLVWMQRRKSSRV